MLPVLGAIAFVWGLTYAGVRWSENPARKENTEKKKLASLKAKSARELTLDEAEDGLVLARRYRDRDFAKFVQVRNLLKPKRVKI